MMWTVARSISRPVRERLYQPHQGRFDARALAVFEQACDLVTHDGEVVGLVSPQIGDGPLNIVVDGAAGLFVGIGAGMPVALELEPEKERLWVGGLGVELGEAMVWGLGSATGSACRDCALPSAPADHLQAPRPHWQPPGADHLQAPRPHWQPPGAAGGCSAPARWRARQGHPLHGPGGRRGAAGGLGRRPRTAAGGSGWTGWPGRRSYARWRRLSRRRDALGLAGLPCPLPPLPRPGRGGRSPLVEVAALRTTTLSAAFLRAAARGECNASWHTLLAALSERPGEEKETKITAVVQEVLAHGATSGADSLAGFLYLSH